MTQGEDITGKALLIESQYLPPIEYFAKIVGINSVILEACEHYVKGSYRNRCYIAGPNGIQRLTVPVLKGKKQHSIIRDIRISYDFDWQRIHWISLCSVYRSSPFFEYFEDDFEPFYTKRFDFLYDLNLELFELLIQIFKLEVPISHTEDFEKLHDEGTVDYRSKILPGKDQIIDKEQFNSPIYHQVFQDRTGFHPNMSIIDLLFNTGPKALDYLRRKSPSVK